MFVYWVGENIRGGYLRLATAVAALAALRRCKFCPALGVSPSAAVGAAAVVVAAGAAVGAAGRAYSSRY